METAARKRCCFVSARRSPPLVLTVTPWIRRDMENRRDLGHSPTSCSISRRVGAHLERWTSSSGIRWAVVLADGVCAKRDFTPSSLLGSAPRSNSVSTRRRCSCWQVYSRKSIDQRGYEHERMRRWLYLPGPTTSLKPTIQCS